MCLFVCVCFFWWWGLCVCMCVCVCVCVCHLQQVEVIITVWCPSRLSTHVWLYTHLATAPSHRNPAFVRYTTRYTGPITQPLSHRHTHLQRQTHAGEDAMWQKHTLTHTHGPADTRITYTLPAAARVQAYTPSLAHNGRLTLEMKLIHHMEHTHTHTHTHKAGIVTFTAHLLSLWHPCLLDTVDAVMNS